MKFFLPKVSNRTRSIAFPWYIARFRSCLFLLQFSIKSMSTEIIHSNISAHFWAIIIIHSFIIFSVLGRVVDFIVAALLSGTQGEQKCKTKMIQKITSNIISLDYETFKYCQQRVKGPVVANIRLCIIQK